MKNYNISVSESLRHSMPIAQVMWWIKSTETKLKWHDWSEYFLRFGYVKIMNKNKITKYIAEEKHEFYVANVYIENIYRFSHISQCDGVDLVFRCMNVSSK